MSSPPKPARFYVLVLLVMGSCIGSGIFRTPSEVATAIPYASLLFPVWILIGFVTLSGALSYGELTARFPQAGGVYVYLKEAYGRLAAFLFGWVVLMAVTSGAIAGLALVFANFLNVFFPMSDFVQKLVAIVLVTVCTTINILGFGLGKQIAGIVTALKVIGIVGLIIAGMLFVQNPATLDWSLPPFTWQTLSVMLSGLVGVYWSYGGWHHLTYLSGEMPDARKRMSGAMVLGVLGVMAAYVMANWAYMRALPLNDLIASKSVAADMMDAVFGEVGGKLVAALVCISVSGSILIYTMSAPRIYFAMAADGIFFPAIARIHPKTGTPAVAIAFQSAWAIVLLFLWGTFGKLVDYVTYTEAVFLVMAAAAVYIFRYRDRKHGIRFDGFRVPGYPFTPLLYILISGAFVVNGLVSNLELALAATGLFVVGVALYFGFKKSLSAPQPPAHKS